MHAQNLAHSFISLDPGRQVWLVNFREGPFGTRHFISFGEFQTNDRVNDMNWLNIAKVFSGIPNEMTFQFHNI